MEFLSNEISKDTLDTHLNNIKINLNNNMTNLTNFLKNEDLKIVLNSMINYPKYDKPILLKRNPNIFGFESYIGMSYDYAIRFLLAYQINKKIDDALFDSIGFQMEKDKKKLLSDYKDYEKTNKLLGLVDLSFKLSLNETFFRSGVEKNIKEFSKDNLNYIYKEIIDLLKISFNKLQEYKESKINFNPVFGYGNILADGDIIIDNTLVDFKVVSSMNNFKDHINQLVMYSVLNQYNDKHQIDFIQMYYPRYNDFPKYKIDNLISKSNFNLLKKIIYFDYSKY